MDWGSIFAFGVNSSLFEVALLKQLHPYYGLKWGVSFCAMERGGFWSTIFPYGQGFLRSTASPLPRQLTPRDHDTWDFFREAPLGDSRRPAIALNLLGGPTSAKAHGPRRGLVTWRSDCGQFFHLTSPGGVEDIPCPTHTDEVRLAAPWPRIEGGGASGWAVATVVAFAFILWLAYGWLSPWLGIRTTMAALALAVCLWGVGSLRNKRQGAFKWG